MMIPLDPAVAQLAAQIKSTSLLSPATRAMIESITKPSPGLAATLESVRITSESLRAAVEAAAGPAREAAASIERLASVSYSFPPGFSQALASLASTPLPDPDTLKMIAALRSDTPPVPMLPSPVVPAKQPAPPVEPTPILPTESGDDGEIEQLRQDHERLQEAHEQLGREHQETRRRLQQTERALAALNLRLARLLPSEWESQPGDNPHLN